MEAVWFSIISGMPVLALHVLATLLVLVVAVSIYLWLTPHAEMKLIKENNVAAGIAMSGAILGLALPLAFCLAYSVNVLDIVMWGSVTLLMQLVAFFILDRLLRDLSQRIQQGEVASALLLAGTKLSVAAVMSAAVVG